jgi:hypothetical protein
MKTLEQKFKENEFFLTQGSNLIKANRELDNLSPYVETITHLASLTKDFNEENVNITILLYLGLYAAEYGFDSTLSFIKSRSMWEKDLEDIQTPELLNRIRLAISELLTTSTALYQAKVNNKKTSAFSLKPLFELNNLLEYRLKVNYPALKGRGFLR